MFEGLLDRVGDLDVVWFLVLAFFLPFGETVALLDVVVPGEVGLALLGASAERAGVPLPVLIGVAAVGAFLGDSTSWYIGRRWGTALLTRWEPVRRRTEGPLRRAENHFAARGGPTVFLARFVGTFRALAPLVAGTSGMPYRRFVPWNAAASIVWVSLVVILGSVLGDAVASTLDRIGHVVTLVVVAAIVVAVVVRRRRTRSSSLEDER